MPKTQKTRSYSEKQLQLLRDTPFKQDNSALYWDLAKKWGRSYGSIYQAHKRVASKSKRTTSVKSATVKAKMVEIPKVSATPAQKGANLVLYSLYSGIEIGGTHETDKFKERMRPLINSMDVYDPAGTRHAVPFDVNKTGILRHWLKTNPDFKGKEFTIRSIAGNKNAALLVRRS